MDYYNFESFDITPLIEQYHGKRLEDLFENHYHIITNKMGEFAELFWEEKDIPNNINLFKTRKKLLYNLKTVNYIGDYIEKKAEAERIKDSNRFKI